MQELSLAAVAICVMIGFFTIVFCALGGVALIYVRSMNTRCSMNTRSRFRSCGPKLFASKNLGGSICHQSCVPTCHQSCGPKLFASKNLGGSTCHQSNFRKNELPSSNVFNISASSNSMAEHEHMNNVPQHINNTIPERNNFPGVFELTKLDAPTHLKKSETKMSKSKKNNPKTKKDNINTDFSSGDKNDSMLVDILKAMVLFSKINDVPEKNILPPYQMVQIPPTVNGSSSDPKNADNETISEKKSTESNVMPKNGHLNTSKFAYENGFSRDNPTKSQSETNMTRKWDASTENINNINNDIIDVDDNIDGKTE
jgi:hypothetical protein